MENINFFMVIAMGILISLIGYFVFKQSISAGLICFVIGIGGGLYWDCKLVGVKE